MFHNDQPLWVDVQEVQLLQEDLKEKNSFLHVGQSTWCSYQTSQVRHGQQTLVLPRVQNRQHHGFCNPGSCVPATFQVDSNVTARRRGSHVRQHIEQSDLGSGFPLNRRLRLVVGRKHNYALRTGQQTLRDYCEGQMSSQPLLHDTGKP